jgi:hypothetical protein
MKAWEKARDLLRNAVPVVLSDEEQDWQDDADAVGSKADFDIAMFWKSSVPGSGAPDSSAVAAIGAMENKGYTLAPYESILTEGFAAGSQRHAGAACRAYAPVANPQGGKAESGSSVAKDKTISGLARL